MQTLSDWLNKEGFANFRQAKHLAEEASKHDPSTEPYISKYKARDIWKSLAARLQDCVEDNGDGILDKRIVKTELKVTDNTANDYHEKANLVACDALNSLPLEEGARTNNHDDNISGSTDCHVVSTEDISIQFASDPPAQLLPPCSVSVRSLLSSVLYELAANFVECEEIKSGQDNFERCLKLVIPGNNDILSVVIATHNQLSVIWSNRSAQEQALEQLTLAEHAYTTQGPASVLSYSEVWAPVSEQLSDQDRLEKLETLHTMTLYYLAQVFGRIGELEKSGRYCHMTLKRQMEGRLYEPMDWSLNCATLSQYYVTKDQYNFARYCLACAELINVEAFEKFNPEKFDNTNEREMAEEKLGKSKADILRCWAKYGLNLLKSSHEKKLQSTGEQGENNKEESVKKKEDEVDAYEKEMKQLRFSPLETTSLEEQVTDSIAGDVSAARKIFQFTQKCLVKAKDFYKLDGYVSDFVEITQDISQSYKYLAFFEDEFDVRCKMHKRRIDMLNAIIIEMSPKHFLQLTRQLLFEIAETYTEMADLKKAIIQEDPRRMSAQIIKKINFLVLKAVQFFQGFIDSYKREDELPDKYEDDALRGVLIAFFCMGRLFSKYLTNDKATRLEYLTKEKDAYTYLVEYADRHVDSMPSVADDEISIAREMLALFNVKRELEFF